MATGQRKKLDWQARQMIFNLRNYFLDLKRDTNSYEYQHDVNINRITAEAAGVSITAVATVAAEGKSLQDSEGKVSFENVNKQKRPRPKKRLMMDCFIEGLIRRRVLQACAENNSQVSLCLIQKIMNEEDIIKCSYEYLRKLLIRIGIKPMTKAGGLVENEGVASRRLKFLTDMNTYREEKRNIVYVDETFFSLESSNKKSKLVDWENDTDNLGVLYYRGRRQGLIVLHAGGKDGFLTNASHFIKTLCIRDSDMNYEVFYKWIQDKLLPNLPKNSVVVMDNAEYHFSDENPQEIEQMLSEHGHVLMRIPPIHQDLNLLELIWRNIKQNNNLDYDKIYDLDDMQNTLQEVFRIFPQDKWDSSIEYVKKMESEYLVYST